VQPTVSKHWHRRLTLNTTATALDEAYYHPL